MKSILCILATCTLGIAYPGLLGTTSEEDIVRQFAERNVAEERQGLLPSVSSLLNDVAGLLGSVASSVDPDDYRPEPGYEFKKPGPKDSRGPCPGLNLLANYGYLPRDGHVNFGQVVNATA